MQMHTNDANNVSALVLLAWISILASHSTMEPETQKIISLLEDLVQSQKANQAAMVEMTRKDKKYKKVIGGLLIVVLVSFLYAIVISLLYYYK